MTSDHILQLFQAINKELPHCLACGGSLSYKNKEIYRMVDNGHFKRNICFDKITISCECGWISEVAMPDKLFYDPNIFAKDGVIKYNDVINNMDESAYIVFFAPRCKSHPMEWALNHRLIEQITQALINNGVKGELECESSNKLTTSSKCLEEPLTEPKRQLK